MRWEGMNTKANVNYNKTFKLKLIKYVTMTSPPRRNLCKIKRGQLAKRGDAKETLFATVVATFLCCHKQFLQIESQLKFAYVKIFSRNSVRFDSKISVLNIRLVKSPFSFWEQFYMQDTPKSVFVRGKLFSLVLQFQ